MPGKKRSPIRGERGLTMTSASPELRLKSRFAAPFEFDLVDDAEAKLLREVGHGRRLTPDHDDVARLQTVAAHLELVRRPLSPRRGVGPNER